MIDHLKRPKCNSVSYSLWNQVGVSRDTDKRMTYGAICIGLPADLLPNIINPQQFKSRVYEGAIREVIILTVRLFQFILFIYN